MNRLKIALLCSNSLHIAVMCLLIYILAQDYAPEFHYKIYVNHMFIVVRVL